MVRSTIRRRTAPFSPIIAIVVAVGVNSIRARGRVGDKRSSGQLIGPQNRIEPCIGTLGGLVFPKSLAAFWLGRLQDLRRSNAPDRTVVHIHDAARFWIESNVEFATARFGRGARRRLENLVARNPWRRRIRAAEATNGPAGSLDKLDSHMHHFAGWRAGHDIDREFLAPVLQRENRCDLRIFSTYGLVIGPLVPVRR